MSYEINNFNEIDKTKIKLGKTFNYSLSDNYNLINIYYLNETNNNTNTNNAHNINNNLQINENKSRSQNVVDEKTKLIIQTPLMYLPNSIIYFNDKPFLELSFNNEDNDKDVSYFKQWIIDLAPKQALLVHGDLDASTWFEEELKKALPNSTIITPQAGKPYPL